MTSIVVLILSIITIITFNGEAADLPTDRVASEIEGCPYLDNGEYKVIMNGSVSAQSGGCAHINFNSSGIESQSFRLWFGNINYGTEHCRDMVIIEYFRFYCLSKSPSMSEDIRRGHMYIKLDDGDVDKAVIQKRRCAVYDKINANDYVTTFRVAISSDDSCDGLSDVVYNSKQIRSHKEGSMLLIFSRTRPSIPPTTASTTTTESIQSISKRYERRGYILQNFGNRPNPFWRTKRTEIQNSGNRELRMSDGRHGEVTDVASYDDLQSNLNDKYVNTSTVMDKNLSLRPLEVNHTEIRSRRSMSNVKSTFKTYVVLAGANP